MTTLSANVVVLTPQVCASLQSNNKWTCRSFAAGNASTVPQNSLSCFRSKLTTSTKQPKNLSRVSHRISCTAGDENGDIDHGNVKEFDTKEAFESYISEAGDKLVVVDVSTRTCGPCKFIFPKIVKMSLDYPDVVFLKIMGDKDANTRAIMREWGVRAVPSFRFFRNGELVHTHTGAKEEVLKENFAKYYNLVSTKTP